ncbi:MAG: GFA family protein [Bacteriovoracaceae bacterium]|nr:GFA family protein [Bacteriovoracaceae bacterium]
MNLPAINNCHCSRCRKATGSSFGTFLHTTPNLFKWTQGEEEINNFTPAKGDPRPFCKTCGSRVPSINLEEEHVIVPAGLIEGDPNLIPSVNIHTDSKACWYSITDDLASFAEDAPDSFWEPYFKAFQENLETK